MHSGIDSAHQRFSRAADELLSDIRRADVEGIHRDVQIRLRAAKIKAFSYVWLAAAVERYVKDLVRVVYDEINGTGIALRQLRPSLLPVALSRAFDSLQDLRRIDVWIRRLEVVGAYDSGEICALDIEALPHDGRTFRPHHIDLLQAVLGFSGTVFRDQSARAALIELAERRNDIAHGVINPIDFGRSKETRSVERTLVRVVDVMDGLAILIDDYLTAQEYLRIPAPP